ncbi:MAG: FHA domain-containing protein [Acidimicrobiia bacterium]|nr:FHA domain-containing protein [Acidimicrobiia bacterium]
MHPQSSPAHPEIAIHLQDGTTRTLVLDGRRVTLGRSSDNELSYPDDPVLSRHHLALELHDGLWFAVDLGSKNGTVINGQRLNGRQHLRPGDRLVAGRVTIILQDPLNTADQTLVFVDEDLDSDGSSSFSARLDDVVSSTESGLDVALASSAITAAGQVQALLDAGRELAEHRPLPELFRVILRLATEAVGAQRGVLMTLEEGELIIRANLGEGFRISNAVRDKVLNERTSLLVQDARSDALLKSSMTIVQQKVRSLIAAPLQTSDQVIGLLYVDSPNIVRPFTSDDLNMLTVMANIAAIRIEHARLIEVEQAERMMAKELEQAAEIQRNLLPKGQPAVSGLDVAGHSIPCRMVGGDYFDYVTLPGGKFGVIVADVAGKGLPAAMLMSSMQARVQILSEDTEDLAEFVTRLNRGIAANCPGNRFITFFMVVFDPATGNFSYCNAGHNPPFLIRASGQVERLLDGGPVLGILRTMNYTAATGRLENGDVLAMFSDGVTEARNDADEEYDEGPFLEELIAHRQQPAKTMVIDVHDALERFLGSAPANDDITLVVVRRHAA